MNGNRFNNRDTRSQARRPPSSEGQVLLLLIMVLGTLLIVAMTAIFQSTSDTQIGGTNQMSQTTLAASEAGLEKGLLTGSSGTYADLGLTTLANIDLQNSRVEITNPRYKTFTTGRLEQDSQYTFYLSDYSPPPAPLFGTPYALTFKIFYESPADAQETCKDVALELTFVYDSDNDGSYETAKRIADFGDKLTSDNTADIYGGTGETTLNTATFQCYTAEIDTAADFPNAKFVMIQNYFQGTKLGFQVTNNADLPPQGRLITSTARAKISNEGNGTITPVPQSGLTRITQIFQSYPQIPAEFWTTSF